MDKDALTRALNKAKVSIMSDKESVFICTILFSLKFSWDNSIPTACTNGLYLKFNPQFFESMNHEERVFVLAHEAWHVAYQHMNRAGTRDFRTWNMAADYVINAMLKNAGYTMPKVGLYDAKFENMSSEQVYDIIYEDPDYDNPDFDEDFDPNSDLTPEEQEEISRAIEDTIVKAHVQAQMADAAGTIPGEVAIFIDKLLNPKLPWEQILESFLTATAPDDYSFRKPNRRYMPDHYLPSLYSEAIGEIAVAVDTSASVTDTEFNRFISEVQAIQTRMNPSLLTIIDFDYEIRKVHEITESTPVSSVEFSGRGGTCIEPVLMWAKENKPIALLVFTDGEFDTVNINPEIPVIWLIHGNKDWKYPFGRVIEYEI